MFDDNVLGLGEDLLGSSFEQETPALPAASQGGMTGDGSGNFEIPLDVSGGLQPGSEIDAEVLTSEPQPGAAIIPLDGQGPIGMDPMAGQIWEGMEPTDTSEAGAVRSAGFTALLAAASVGTGIALGGPWGAVAGLLMAGALANGYRTQKLWDSQEATVKHEAVVSGVFGAAAAGMGIYAAWKAYQQKQEEE